ncbi:aminoglycoside 3'-phosphotransferase [Mycobacterium sp. CPCC 205372]|uniref:Aminoglycoside 3'-phosphotransferase n=1 Tax=Mycobacterium hippophais TaxID=3016340 RepID=A0ABT4Q122_9MYCO|nr:aminoglycoside 3'-phosphotransferase [Mycobacterium hippophais]MCZ8382556.1 aminoglycoside 3'-phosphotransferase [Mycobacterium hippophais]
MTDPTVRLPDVVATLADGSPATLVWRNELGGLTFRIDRGRNDTRYVKWVALGTPEIDLAAEAERLAWAQPWAVVPRVLDHGRDATGEWLVTEEVPGRSAVEWKGDPAVAAAAIGRGLRSLHDALPPAECPFEWSVQRRLLRADARIADGEGPAQWAPEHRHLGLPAARAHLDDPPPIDRLVVCHGDACTPNTLLHDDGGFAAHVDLGSLGVADRWADLAVATWSLDWDYGPGFDRVLLQAYGIEADEARIAYYRLLYDLA